MKMSAARARVALLAACAAITPSQLLAGQTLLNRGAEGLAEGQAALLLVQTVDPYGLSGNETVIEAVGTPGGEWTPVEKMRPRRNPNRALRRHAGDDLIALAPGRYLLRVACHGHDFERRFDDQPLEVAAGQEYLVSCRGRAESGSSLGITARAALPFGATRPVRTALLDMPAGHDVARVGEAVRAALANRGWRILAEESGRIDAGLQHGKSAASVRIQYDPHEASFAFLAGTNLNPHIEDGEAAVHYNYYRWIGFLGADIELHLAGEPLTE